MKKLLFACVLLSIFLSSAQEKKINAELQHFTPITADRFVGYDKFGFFYVIQDNALLKWKDGKSVEYKNLALGKITKVDLQNPLKILLFYENFNSVVTLDNQLNETQKINFSENPQPIVVSATGMASQNRFWIYDTLSQQLGLWDYLKNTYITITPPFQGNFMYYTADFNYFQWIDDKHDWYTCDVFGKINAMGKAPDFDAIQITDSQQLVFMKDGQMHLWNAKRDQKQTVDNIDKSGKSFFLKDQILSIFTDHGITNYKIITP